MKRKKIIPFGTPIIYTSPAGWRNCKCYCGHYNAANDTYSIFAGWDLYQVSAARIKTIRESTATSQLWQTLKQTILKIL